MATLTFWTWRRATLRTGLPEKGLPATPCILVPVASIPGGLATIEGLVSGKTGWQPIETAPKDGTPVLLFDCGAYWLVEWNKRTGRWEGLDSSFVASPEPGAHWMPLPAAPEGDHA